MQKDLTQGSVLRTIVVFAVPFLISYFLQIINFKVPVISILFPPILSIALFYAIQQNDLPIVHRR